MTVTKRLIPINAGYYSTDAGAALGVLPRAIWEKRISVDDLHRQKVRINLLLIQYEDRLILIDSGIGNKLIDKKKKIYNYADFLLPASLQEVGFSRFDITDVILTHLHFDHAGGIISIFNDTPELTFPNARHWVQNSEWHIAKSPDELNAAAYNYDENLALLEQSSKLKLIEGNYKLTDDIELIKVGGHTVGFQIVKFTFKDDKAIFAGDIIPTREHLPLPIISAYDISRKDTFYAKKMILESDSRIYFSHDIDVWSI
ncbi:MAG: MBL fold metallo-hydrolase [Candidatus Cloacimonetes bacterium]|nr:MBL fold metallo-hydrolase [Candidatus Cloacimonadota bacterium]